MVRWDITKDIERKRISDINQGPLFRKNFAKIMGYNPKLGLENVGVHTQFGQILPICSQDIKRKRNSDVNQGA